MEEKKLTGYPSIDKPWLKYYSEEAIKAPLPECTLYEYLWENNKDFPNDIAIEYLGRKIKYKELFFQIDQYAKALISLGVQEKEIVTVALPSIPEALYLVYALNRIGAVANMVHPLAGEQELVNYLNEVNSRFVFMFDGTYHIIKDALSATSVEKAIVISIGASLTPILKHIYLFKNRPPQFSSSVFETWHTFLSRGKKTVLHKGKKDPFSLALISHTGGTTGEPKGVMCSDYTIIACIWQSICCFTHTRQGCALAVLPPFVNYSLVQSMLEMLFIGYKVVLMPNYFPDRFVDYIQEYRPNIILSIPKYWEALIGLEKSIDMSCFELLYYGGESMSEEIEHSVNKVLKMNGSQTELCKGLGSTELMSVATQTYPWCNATGSVGIPLVKLICKIIDPQTNRELQYNEQGEICFSGPTLMIGYYNNKEATDEIVKIHADGQRWLHTGDLGYMDENGVLYVTGRIKRIIMTKGEDQQVTKLFPDRIEKVLASHHAVQASCVIGIPDKARIHYPKAIIELNTEYAPTAALIEEIRAFCVGKLPNYQIPDVIEFVDALPRTERGKIDYRALEKQAEEMKNK